MRECWHDVNPVMFGGSNEGVPLGAADNQRVLKVVFDMVFHGCAVCDAFGIPREYGARISILHSRPCLGKRTYPGNHSSGKTTRLAPALAASSIRWVALTTVWLRSNFTSVQFLFITGSGQFAGGARTIATVKLLYFVELVAVGCP